MLRLIVLGVILPGVLLAAQPPVARIPTESAPPGGWAQIKVYLDPPVAASNGTIVMDFDPAIFGDIANVAAFSASGDAIGYANVSHQHVDAHFSSRSGGLGRLAGLPAFTVSIPVLASALPGATASITLDPVGSTWQAAAPATFTVGGNLSIQSVFPGGGILPAGTVLHINGTGFDSTTTASIDGVVVSQVNVASPQELQVTLGGATEMTGKRVHVANPDGSAVDYFSALPSSPANTTTGVHSLLPLTTFTSLFLYNILPERQINQFAVALLNQNLTPVDVVLEGIAHYGDKTLPELTFRVPPGSLYWVLANPLVHDSGFDSGISVITSAPIRMLQYQSFLSPLGGPAQIAVSLPDGSPATNTAVQLPVSPSTISWSWQIGTPAPSTSIGVLGSLGFTVSVPASAASWLSVSPLQGTAPATLNIAATPGSLAPGTHTTTLTVTPVLPDDLSGVGVLPTTIPVSLVVSVQPLISATGQPTFQVPVPGGPIAPNFPTVIVTSNGRPAPFTTTIRTNNGTNWLSVTPSSGVTPATLTVSANPAGQTPGYHSGFITIQGPANSVTIGVPLVIYPITGPPPELQPNNPGLTFQLQTGATAPSTTQTTSVTPAGDPISTTVQTQTGGDWLTAVVVPNTSQVSVTTSARNLAPGAYQGTVTIISATHGSVQIAVNLTVYAAPTAPPTVTPSSISLTEPPGGYITQNLAVSAGGVPVAFTVDTSTSDGGGWLMTYPLENTFPNVLVAISPGQPGEYHGSIVVNTSSGSVTVPVTLTVQVPPPPPQETTPQPPPIMATIVNAASQQPTGFSPGEIITIYGTGLATSDPNSTQVLIYGMPATLIYASASQVNAIVPLIMPASRTSNTVNTIHVHVNGLDSTGWDVPFAAWTPAIFTLDSSGTGQGAILNQDNTVNGPANPAAPGTTIQIYGTGISGTSPPVSLTIGSMDAVVSFAGQAPGAVSGLLQVNAVVPLTVSSGPAVPIAIKAGDAQSANGVTVAIK